jgi:hypothetical protein
MDELASMSINQLLRSRLSNSPRNGLYRVMSSPDIADILRAGIEQFSISKDES